MSANQQPMNDVPWTTQQRTVINSKAKLLFVSACPGAGKTTIIVERIGALVASGLLTSVEVLCLSHSNAAVDQLQNRLKERSDELQLDGVMCRTIHSVCYDLLAGSLKQQNLMHTMPRIIDKTILEQIVRHTAQSLHIDLNENAINDIMKADALNQQPIDSDNTKTVYAAVTQLMHNNRYMSIHRLVWTVVEMIKSDGARFGILKYVKLLIIDECQDLNWSQYAWMQMFIERFNVYVMCVGDVDQSIFGSMNFFEQNTSSLFRNLIVEATRTERAQHSLTVNHRCTQRIQHLASTILAQQKHNNDSSKMLSHNNNNNITTKVVGMKPVLWDQFSDPLAQATFIAKKVVQLTGGGGDVEGHKMHLNEIAILVRFNRDKVAIQETFNKYGIPIRVLGVPSWLQHSEVKELIGMLQLSLHWMPFTFRLVYEQLELMRRQRPTTNENPQAPTNINCVDKLITEFTTDANIISILPQLAGNDNPIICLIAETIISVRDIRVAQKIALTTLPSSSSSSSSVSSSSSSSSAVRAQLQSIAKCLNIQQRSSAEVTQLFEFSNEMEFAEQLLEKAANWSRQAEESRLNYDPDIPHHRTQQQEQESTQNKQAVTLSTIHGTKGFEWNVVFLCNLNDYRLTEAKKHSQPYGVQYDEECRLYYTACTRAKNYLFCSYVAEEANPLLSILPTENFQQLLHKEQVISNGSRLPVVNMVGQDSICYLQCTTDMGERSEYILCNGSTVRIGRSNSVNEIAFGSLTLSRSNHFELKFLNGIVSGISHRISWLNGRTTLSAGTPFKLVLNSDILRCGTQFNTRKDKEFGIALRCSQTSMFKAVTHVPSEVISLCSSADEEEEEEVDDDEEQAEDDICTLNDLMDSILHEEMLSQSKRSGSFAASISTLNQSTPIRPKNDHFNSTIRTHQTTTAAAAEAASPATVLLSASSSIRPIHPAIRNILSLEQRHRAETHQPLIKQELDLSLEQTIYPLSEHSTLDPDATLYSTLTTSDVAIAIKEEPLINYAKLSPAMKPMKRKASNQPIAPAPKRLSTGSTDSTVIERKLQEFRARFDVNDKRNYVFETSCMSIPITDLLTDADIDLVTSGQHPHFIKSGHTFAEPDAIYKVHSHLIDERFVHLNKTNRSNGTFTPLKHSELMCQFNGTCVHSKFLKCWSIKSLNSHSGQVHKEVIEKDMFERAANVYLCWVTMQNRILYLCGQMCVCGRLLSSNKDHVMLCPKRASPKRWQLSFTKYGMEVVDQYIPFDQFAELYLDEGYVDAFIAFLHEKKVYDKCCGNVEFGSWQLDEITEYPKLYMFFEKKKHSATVDELWPFGNASSIITIGKYTKN